MSNRYITPLEFLYYTSSTTPTTNTIDDAVINQLIIGASRFIDNYVGRKFYPRVQTKKYDVPNTITRRPNRLELNDDLLELETLTNGDSTVVTSSDYILEDVNNPPYYNINLRDTSSIDWEPNSDGSTQQVISVFGTWGFHENYTDAWMTGGTSASSINSTDLSFTVSSGSTISTGNIIKIDDEIMDIISTSGSTATVEKRGANGSTAATHNASSTIYYWNAMYPVKIATYMIVRNIYKERSGQGVSSESTVTAAGVIIPPKDVPKEALEMIEPYMRLS